MAHDMIADVNSWSTGWCVAHSACSVGRSLGLFFCFICFEAYFFVFGGGGGVVTWGWDAGALEGRLWQSVRRLVLPQY